jgi:hypothetical protein
VFDYQWYHEQEKGGGWLRYTCAVATVEADCPPVLIERRGDHDPGDRPIGSLRFESAQFEKDWVVQGADPVFATALVDQRMIEWLLANGEGFRFFVVGRHALVFRRQMPAEQVPLLLAAATGFVERIPSVVASLAPPAPLPAAAAVPAPPSPLAAKAATWRPRTAAPVIAFITFLLGAAVGVLLLLDSSSGTRSHTAAAFTGFAGLTLESLRGDLVGQRGEPWYPHLTGVRPGVPFPSSVTVETDFDDTAGDRKLAGDMCFAVWQAVITESTATFTTVVVDDGTGTQLQLCNLNTI